ncbi:retrovirus-related Pol polyprotein from transposon 17.6 [Trichonephila clavipes]|uniref:RNA-directed DNA polymerase n=1 Tax=Trichonephila clavipes TaxID=2585209 RepID=A0A8X6SAT5_TRICX|nr:retrovirus-related Pol polyprotein from transposon 17.6 [Trichonephila clavipes]
MQYQCILDIDFMKESKLTLDFDQKSLIIPDGQIKQLPKVEKPVEIDLSDTKLGEGQKQKLTDLFNGFKGLFSDQPGLIHVLYHEIDTGDKGPVLSRLDRYYRVKQGIIDYLIEKMLQEGTIRPVQSPYASPVVLTRKNNGLPPDSPEAYRFAIDYRKLKAIIKYPRYPLPVIDDLITNIPHTGPAPNFQKAIDIILKPIIGCFVIVYMDDVIITSPSFDEHIDRSFESGLIISKEGIETDNSKVKAIAEMKPPKNNREVSKFLGMAGWYEKFMPHYADICEPLYRLKKKGAKFNWSTEAQGAFDKIKRALTEAPVLQLPNFKEQFNLFTDASGVGIGAVLNQNHRPIAFASRTLNKAERNYTVTKRECLAVIWALNKFKTYFGSLPVKVITDHSALTKLTNGKNLSSPMIRWALKLSEFNIEWEH